MRPAESCKEGMCTVRGERAWGDGSASGMHGEGPTQGCGPRAHAERTENMFAASVTLDMSKLSAWLNADAYCRVNRRTCDAGRGTAREA